MLSLTQQKLLQKELNRIFDNSNITTSITYSIWNNKRYGDYYTFHICLQYYKHNACIFIEDYNNLTKEEVQITISNLITDLKVCNNPRDVIAMFLPVKDFAHYAKVYDL